MRAKIIVSSCRINSARTVSKLSAPSSCQTAEDGRVGEEGAASVFKPISGADWIVGAVGPLQFEVMTDRIRTEFDVPVLFEPTGLFVARWVEADNQPILKEFIEANKTSIANDHVGAPVYLARNAWHLDRGVENWPDIRFQKIKDLVE